METAASAGDRSAMIYLAKAYESGDGLGLKRLVWYYQQNCSLFV